MSDIKEYTEAAAALIRLRAGAQRGVSDTYLSLGEMRAWERSEGIANAMDRAARLLREDADPRYDAKAAAASHLADAVFRYLSSGGGVHKKNLSEKLAAYDAIDDEDN